MLPVISGTIPFLMIPVVRRVVDDRCEEKSAVAIVMRQNEFDAKVAQEQFPRANRAGLAAVCDWYVKEVIPRHFNGNAWKGLEQDRNRRKSST